MKLGDAFPEHIKKQLAEANLKVGSVIKTYVYDTTPPKEKYFVILGFSFDKIAIGCVYINSEINPNVFPTERLRALHLPILAIEHAFLLKDSYVDCSDIKEKDYDEVLNTLNSFPGTHVGEVSAPLMGNIIQTLKTAHTIAPIVIKKFRIDQK